MNKTITFSLTYLCILMLAAGPPSSFAQSTNKKDSPLPASGLAGQAIKPPATIPLSSEGSMAYGNNLQTSDFYSFDIDDPLNWASINSVGFVSYSGDFATNDNDHMWILDGNDNYLKKVEIVDGAVVDSIFTPCPITNGVWTAISFHRATGQLYGIAVSLDISDSRLFEIDIATGSSAELMSFGALTMVSGTFDMSGNLFALDLENDSTYKIDVYNLSIETLGHAGFNANFSQGMGCVSETNAVYLAAFTNDGDAELRLLNKSTGAATFVESLPGETTAFGFPVTDPPLVYSVHEVYTETGLNDGDTVWITGYYTDTDINFLIEDYFDWLADQIMPPQSVLTLEGDSPPVEAQNGGLIYARGILSFENVSDPTLPEDTLMAHLNVKEVFMVLEGMEDETPVKNASPGNKQGQGSVKDADCDSCKFAVLISGGIDSLNNKRPKYWLNLVALYKFKVDSQGYCPENVIVHYFKGDRRDDQIPQERVVIADSTHIDSSFNLIAKRVAACTKDTMMATFQKMVTNHGASDGGIHLLDDNILEPEHLRDLQQMIIDSCCSLVYDEFLQCYG